MIEAQQVVSPLAAMKHYEAALLEAFPRGATGDVFEHWNKARQAIAEAEKHEVSQEPVAWVCYGNNGEHGLDYDQDEIDIVPVGTMLYTHPQPAAQWVGLPDMQVFELADEHLYGGKNYGILSFYQAIEAKLKQKNGYAVEKNT
ncbi:MAG: hypothetical protein EBR30_29380 [Cytophagia bacterium]|jgi:hypothetical protein|nr:hypothetical protein [Cytophagia bacterium]NBW39056.1 hypothetical protein [Cytophagia bacterium]